MMVRLKWYLDPLFPHQKIVIEVGPLLQNFLDPRMLANLESRLLDQDLNALKAINTLKTSFFSCSDEAFT